jgi:hypothetical protein
MRRWGWMELGFQHGFFLRLLRRSGWRAAFHPMPNCGRANAYVAEPAPPTLLRLGEPYDMGRFADGWEPPEGAHRWAKEGESVLPLPAGFGDDRPARVALRVSNPDTAAKRLVVADGRQEAAVSLRPGEAERTVELRRSRATRLLLRCEHEPDGAGAATAGGAPDARRRRGVAVHDVERIEPAAVQLLRAGGASHLLRAIGRPLWRRLPESVRARVRARLPR